MKDVGGAGFVLIFNMMILMMMKERRWVLMIIPRCDIDGVGEEQ